MTKIKQNPSMGEIFSQHIKAKYSVKELDSELTKAKRLLKKANLDVQNAHNSVSKSKAQKKAKTMKSNLKDSKQKLSEAKILLGQYEKVTEEMVNFLVAKCDAIEEFSNEFDAKYKPKLNLKE